MAYEKVGSISLWNGDSDKARAPVLRGEVEIGDQKYAVSLWAYDGDKDGNIAEGAPAFKGGVEVRTDG